MKIDVLNILHLACSNRCFHCGYGGSLNQQGSPAKESDVYRWLRYMDLAKTLKVPLVVFSGGDPTEHPFFTKLVIEAMWRELSVQIETHGQQFVNTDSLNCFGSGRKFSFVIPLHGATADVHDRIVGRQGAFNRTLRAISNIRGCLMSRIACMSVIQSENVRTIPEIAKLSFDLGANMYFGTLVQICGSAKSEESIIFPSCQDIALCIEETASLGLNDRIFFNGVPFCLMGQHKELSINYPPSFTVGDAFEMMCYPADPMRDYIVLKTLFPKRPTCATCLPSACSRFTEHSSDKRQCNRVQRLLMERYCTLCDGCFFQKICPGLPLAAIQASKVIPVKKISSQDGLQMIIGDGIRAGTRS